MRGGKGVKHLVKVLCSIPSIKKKKYKMKCISRLHFPFVKVVSLNDLQFKLVNL